MVTQVLTVALLTGLFLTSCNENKNNRSIQDNTKTTQEDSPLNKIINKEDVIVGRWVEPNPINEKEVQGIEIIKGGNVNSINMATLVYSKWWTKDNHLFLVEESIGNHTSSIDTISFEIIKIDTDSLILKDKNLILRYKRQ